MSTIQRPLPPAVERALETVGRHPACADSRLVAVPAQRGEPVIVEVNFRVALPFAWSADGVSPKGVREVEPVTLTFPAGYPLQPPNIGLRADFDRSLAHVQPGSPGDPPVPCIYDGPLRELMAHEGFAGVLNQLTLWLDKAALGRLMDPAQGWEPVRRDSLFDNLVASGADLRGIVTSGGGHAFLEFCYLRFDLSSLGGQYAYRGLVRERIAANPANVVKQFESKRVPKGAVTGSSVAVLVWPRERRRGQPVVADRYLPETVGDFRSLQERASLYGCEEPLNSAFGLLDHCLEGKGSERTVPVAVVLCARRPFPLINSTSKLELCCYIVETGPGPAMSRNDATVVRPAAHEERIAVPLLRRMSHGADEDYVIAPWVQLGCGSLGSKIALHLAREGQSPAAVVDRAYLGPHHAARHGLIPSDGTPFWLDSKAGALAQAIQGLGQKTTAHKCDVIALTRDTDQARRVFPRGAAMLVNATASLSVREALASAPERVMVPRVIETSLYAGGSVGLLTVEGANRNPNTGDLIARAYELMREDPTLAEKVYGGNGSLRRLTTGDGCGTTTMVMSDARLSLMAAAMAEAVSVMQRRGLPDAGRILLGQVAANGISISWRDEPLAPVVKVALDGESGWQVRLSAHAHEKVLREVVAWPGVETGGVLLGRFSEPAQTFYVVDVMDAPEDSLRSATLFVLGKQGLSARLEDYGHSCNHSLYCLGTWHSHLGEFGASGTDRQTARAVALGRAMPAVLLIRTPTNYRAILARSK